MIKLHTGESYSKMQAHIGDAYRAPAHADLLRTPSNYLAATAGPATYTCPMHPQIRQNGPGNCPICGMTLEPVAAS